MFEFFHFGPDQFCGGVGSRIGRADVGAEYHRSLLSRTYTPTSNTLYVSVDLSRLTFCFVSKSVLAHIRSLWAQNSCKRNTCPVRRRYQAVLLDKTSASKNRKGTSLSSAGAYCCEHTICILVTREKRKK